MIITIISIIVIISIIIITLIVIVYHYYYWVWPASWSRCLGCVIITSALLLHYIMNISITIMIMIIMLTITVMIIIARGPQVDRDALGVIIPLLSRLHYYTL